MIIESDILKKFNNIGIGVIEEKERVVIFFSDKEVFKNDISELSNHGFISISDIIGIQDIADDLFFTSLKEFKKIGFHLKYDDEFLIGKYQQLVFNFETIFVRDSVNDVFGGFSHFFLVFHELLNNSILKVETELNKKQIFKI